MTSELRPKVRVPCRTEVIREWYTVTMERYSEEAVAQRREKSRFHGKDMAVRAAAYAHSQMSTGAYTQAFIEQTTLVDRLDWETWAVNGVQP
jgi:hypothetical protein